MTAKKFYITKNSANGKDQLYKSDVYTWSEEMEVGFTDFVYHKKSEIVNRCGILPSETFTVKNLD